MLVLSFAGLSETNYSKETCAAISAPPPIKYALLVGSSINPYTYAKRQLYVI